MGAEHERGSEAHLVVVPVNAVAATGSCPLPHGELVSANSTRDKTRWYRERVALVDLRGSTRTAGFFYSDKTNEG